MRRDRLAAGAASESYGPIQCSQEKWESIFRKPEKVKQVSTPKRRKKIQDKES